MKFWVWAFFLGWMALSARAAEDAPDEAPLAAPVRYVLLDQHGRTVTDTDFHGRYQLLAFGYTFCPDICPTTLAEMALILKKLGGHAVRLQPLFITVDPERDTAAVLKNYTAFFDERILGLTGSPQMIRRLANHYRVRYEKYRAPGMAEDRYTVDHSAGMFLLDAEGRFLVKFAYATPPAEIAARIEEILTSGGVQHPLQ